MAIFSNIQHLINGVDIDTLLSQIEELTNELKKEKAESRKSISTLSSKLERAQKKNDTLKEDLTRETNKCHIAESKLAESESRIVSLAKENDELLKTEDKLKADLQKLGASNSSLNGKNLTLHNKVTKLEDQIKNLKDEINAKDSEISSVNKNAERIENRLKNETSLLDEAKNLVETLNEDNQQLKAEISIKTEENTIISSEVENLKKINQELNADREDKLQRISVLEKDIKEIQDTFESVTCDNNRLQQTCATISSDNQELKSKNDELSDRFTTLNSDFESLKTKNDRICSELELQKTALEQANAENTQLKNDLQTVQNEFTSAQEQLDVYGKNLDSLQSQILILNSEKEELKPYMYLIDAKKEEEAKERALNLAKDNLQELVDRANSVLQDLKHDEVSTLLSSAISTAQELIESAKDITVIDEAKQDLDNSINQAQLKEQELIEEELRKIKEEEEAKERAFNLAKDNLQTLIDKANDMLSDLKHEEVSAPLSLAISIAQEQIDSAKDITAINEAKQDLDNSFNQTQLKEKQLIEEEQRKLKEEEEAKELALNQAKETLQELIDKANDMLSDLKHDEVSTLLSSAISTAQDQLSSAKDIAAIDEAKHDLDKSINQAQSKEADLLEEEQREQQEKEASENAAKILSETRNALTRLIDEAKIYKETIEYADIATELQYVIESVEKFSEVNSDNIQEIQSNISSLKAALSNAKNEVTSEKKTQSHIVKRSILEIFDTKEGDIIESEKFFKRPEHELVRWRRIFEESILYAEHRFICTNCRQDVKISGRKYERGQVAFFSHLHDSDFCEIKTTTGLSKEQIEARKYGLISESERHKRLKKLIHEALEGYYSRQKGINNVVEEKRVNSDIPYLNWRRPDVMADYNGMHLVFELQLSTTFVSVVVQRDIFYRLNDYFIIWVFNFDDNEKYVDLTNLMCKDIYYANKRNVFIFDKDAQRESEERGELVLKCNWLDIDNTWHYSNAKGNGDGVLITLDQLKFDQETCKPYYFDAETPYYEIHPSVKERILKEERSKQEMLDNLQARVKREAEEAIIKRDAALKDMVENNGTVTPFKDGNRYGFKYNNVVLVPARYSAYYSFGEKGMYKVSFNRHYGLIDRYGNEIYSCNYLDFHCLSNGVIIAESTSGFYMSGFGSISERSPHDWVSLKYVSSEIAILQHNNSDLNVFIIDDELVLKKDYNGYSFYLLSGEKKTDAVYSEIRFTKNKSAIWLRNASTKQWQIAELDGTPRSEKLYVECKFNNNVTIAKAEEKCDVYNSDGDFIISTEYDKIEDFANFELCKVCKNNLFGLVNLQFEEIIPTIYSEIKNYGTFIIANKDALWAIFDKDGVNLSDNIYSEIKLFKPYNSNWSNWLLVKKNEKFGLYNEKGKQIVAPKYDSIDISEDFIIVSSNGKQGLINKEGLTLIENKYDSIETLRNNNNLKCQIENKFYLFINETSSLSAQYYDSIEKLTNYHLTAKVGDCYGLLDVFGNTCIPFEYEHIDLIHNFDDDNYVFKCKKNGNVCAFDISKQKEIIPSNYDDIKYIVGDKLYGIKSKESWGLYNIEKGQISEVKYSQMSYNDEDTIAASIIEDNVELHGYLDINGQEIFSSETKSEDGFFIKEFFGKWGVYNEKGDILLPLEVMEAMSFTNQKGYFKVRKESKYGIKHISGKYVVNPECRDIISKEDEPFWILQLIRYKTEQKSKSVPYSSYSYSWGRRRYHTSYRTKYWDETVEYNPYKLVKLDGSQNDFSKDICGEFNSMSFLLKNFVVADNRLISLLRLSISSDKYTNYSLFEEDNDFILTESNGNYGLISSSLNEIIPCKYSHISIWGKNLFIATASEKNYYREWTYYNLFNRNGELCPIGNLSSIENLENGKAKVQKDGQYGLIDESGNVIPDNVSRVDKHIMSQTVFGRLEILDNLGKKLFGYNDNISCVEVLAEGCYKVKKYNQWALFIISRPTYFTVFSYESIDLWTESIAILSKTKYIPGDNDDDEGKHIKVYELKSLCGNVVTDKEYTSISPISDGVAIASRDGYTGQINVDGEEIYDTIERIDDNLSKRRKFGVWDVVDKNNTILPLKFNNITLLNNKYLLTAISSGSYFSIKSLYDLSGKKVLEYDFNTLTDCGNGYYIISKDSVYALMDSSMLEIIPFSRGYVYMRKWADSKYVASKSLYSYYSYNANYIILDSKGNVLTKSNYSKIGDLENGRAQVVLNGKTGFITESCEVIVDDIDERGDWKITKSFDTFCLNKDTNVILQELSYASFLSSTIVKFKKNNNGHIKLFSLDSEKELSNSYSSIQPLEGEYADAVKPNGLKGKIDTNGNEYVEIIEENANWKIIRSFERFFLTYNSATILGDLCYASFVCDNLVKYKDSQKSLFKLYSINSKESLLNTYKSIELTEDSKIVATNDKNQSGVLDVNGIEVYDEQFSLSDNILAKRKFAKYDVFIDQNMVLSGILEVSLWSSNRLKIKNVFSKYQIYSTENCAYIGESFNNIAEIQDGKAKVVRNGSSAYIDINGNILPEIELVVGNNLIKKKTLGYWNVVDNNDQPIIEGAFREIGTYKGRFIKFDGSDFRVLDKKYPKPIPVIGTFYRQYTSTLIYLVGGHYVRIQIKNLELNGKSVTEYTKEHSTLKLIINYINFKKQAVYGVPYKEMNPKTFVPFEDNQEIEGEIYKVLPFGIRIKFPDGRLTLIHKNRLAEIGYQDVLFTIGQSITIVKKGYDDEHKADIWDIIQIK